MFGKADAALPCVGVLVLDCAVLDLPPSPTLLDRVILPSWLLFRDAGLAKFELLLCGDPLDTSGCTLFKPGLFSLPSPERLDRILADVTEPVFGLPWMLSKRLSSDVPARLLVVVDIR